ncbi:B12-binding domain-containing radical SAM protein [Streptomyces sp. NPDC090493]|uniref:B12-binding domain-containing radical SAM protein n=1 Tax=Streptomyces sp. NPDC090493 TaxID=3365964 RepID=UPI0037F18C2C
MSRLLREIEDIRKSEIPLCGPYRLTGKAPDSLRVVFLLPYMHEMSLMCMGPLALYDLVNRGSDIPAVAERAIRYSCLRASGNRLAPPEGEVYRTIESASPVATADIVGVSIANSGDLPSFFRLLDLAGIPRRSADRVFGRHPLVVGGNGGFANPEILADYVDVVALGEGEASMVELIRVVHRARGAHAAMDPELAKESVLEELSRVPGLYVPAMYDCELRPGGGVTAVRPRTPRVPAKVRPQFLGLDELHAAHFVAPISNGKRGVVVPTLGCRWACHFCTLGVPPFRQAPFELLDAYLEELEKHDIAQVVISSATFTQYGKRYALLDRLREHSHRMDGRATTIIGSIRADELSARYLDAVSQLGDTGHFFTELKLGGPRGIVTLAPEFAAPDLVRIFNKTMTPQRVHRSIDLLRENEHFAHIMLYFIVGAPGETAADRRAVADYAVDVFRRFDRANGTVILKLQQFMPEPGTVSQRLPMADPALMEGHVEEIRERLRELVGTEAHERNYRVVWDQASRLLLESVCLRGDRRIGHVLESLHDAGVDPARISAERLREALTAHGLDHGHYLRRLDPYEPVPWEVVNDVDRDQESRLMTELDRRGAGDRPTGMGTPGLLIV